MDARLVILASLVVIPRNDDVLLGGEFSQTSHCQVEVECVRMVEVVLADVLKLLVRALSVEVVERNDGALAYTDPLEDYLAKTGFA